MRYTAILLSALLSLSLSACKTARQTDSSEPMDTTTSVAVPLPVVTPFDAIPGARRAYLDAYQLSYGSGPHTFALPPVWAGRVGELYDPKDPRVRGWRDGKWAARIEASKLLNPE